MKHVLKILGFVLACQALAVFANCSINPQFRGKAMKDMKDAELISAALYVLGSPRPLVVKEAAGVVTVNAEGALSTNLDLAFDFNEATRKILIKDGMCSGRTQAACEKLSPICNWKK